MKFERKVKNPELAGKSVFAWVIGEISNEEILAVLVEQGALTDSEAIDAYVEEMSAEHDLVHVFIDDICVEVDAKGELTVHDIDYDEETQKLKNLLGGE